MSKIPEITFRNCKTREDLAGAAEIAYMAQGWEDPALWGKEQGQYFEAKGVKGMFFVYRTSTLGFIMVIKQKD